jgi:hypothetical protein
LWLRIAITKLQKCKSPGSDQIPACLIQEGGGTLVFEIQKLITSIWNKEELLDQWKESIILAISKKNNETDCSKYHGISFFQG